MASYAYGGLKILVSADTTPMHAEVAASATKAGEEAGRTLSASISRGLGKSAKSLGKGVATALGTATIAATAFGVESFKAAAKVDTMNSALRALAKANGTSYPQMQKTVQALRKQGIEAGAAQSLVASFTKQHLDLAKAQKLATVAQNAATITGKSSAETIANLNKGIATQNVRLLRTAGVGVDVKKAMADYAAQLGVNVKALTSTQKSQAVLNAVLAGGSKVAGAYAAAMKTPGGVLKQLPVIVDEIKVSVGEGLVKALGPAIVGVGHLATVVQESIEPGGKLAPIFDAIGKSATSVLSPLTSVVDVVTRWLEGMDPGKVEAMAGALAKFAPELAAVGSGLAAFAGKNLLGDLPVVGKLLGGLGGPLGIVITSLATLALTSPAARDALGQLAKVVTGALAPVMAEVVPLVGQLGQALAVLLAAGIKAVLPLLPPLVAVLVASLAVVTPLVPVITALSNVLAKVAPVLVPLVAVWWAYTAAMDAVIASTEAGTVANIAYRAGMVVGYAQVVATTVASYAMAAAQLVVRGATIAWTAAQWLLNVALDANPIGLVIAACVALAGVLVLLWTRSDTFRKIVSAAWSMLSGVIGTISKTITNNISTMMRVTLAIVTLGQSELVRVVITHWQQITSAISRAWAGIVNGARSAGANVINGLKAGMSAAISGIGGWIKKSIVDPIVSHVKSFFGIHSPSTVMMGLGEMLTKGLFLGMVPGMSGVGSLVGDVFGGFPSALAAMIHHGLIGIAGLPGKALNAIMSLFGGGGNASALAATASKYNGHRYVWGGGANANTGFDCSSFVNMLGGMLGLGLPGGFHAPSSQHGPATGGWLAHPAMKRIGQSAMAMNDLYVSATHMGVVTGKGTGFAARSTASGTGPQPVGGGYNILRFPGGGLKLPSWLSGIAGSIMGKIGGLFGGLFGHGPSGGQPTPAGVGQWQGLMSKVLGMFGRVDLLPVFMAQIASESGGNQFAQNNTDINARRGTPSKGLLQVIQPTFDAFAGPFKSLGIWSPMANLYAAVAYALKTYGSRIASVLGHGHGYAKGGIIGEHVVGIGQSSGQVYHIGEAGPERVSPLTGPTAGLSGLGSGGCVIHVHPSAGMNERALAAMVSRELAWATAGGAA